MKEAPEQSGEVLQSSRLEQLYYKHLATLRRALLGDYSYSLSWIVTAQPWVAPFAGVNTSGQLP